MWRLGGRFEPRDLRTLLLFALPACAAGDAPPERVFAGLRTESMLTAPVAAAASPTAAEATAAMGPSGAEAIVTDADARQLERDLRNELATAADPTDAVLELADLLTALERHREALAVVATVLQRIDAPALLVCRAALLRDLGRPREAAAALLAMAASHGAAAMHPGLLFECAELQWLVGDADGATATLRELEAAHPGDPWCDTNRLALDALAAEMAASTKPPRARVRDLLGCLRGEESAADRIRLLSELVQLADRETSDHRRYLRDRAVAIACGDASPAVRARAVQLAEATGDAESFVRAALDDDAPLVRRVAAERTAEFAPAAAVGLLIAAIAREDDAAAFAAMHRALGRLVADPPALTVGDELDPAMRARVVAAWEQRCNP